MSDILALTIMAVLFAIGQIVAKLSKATLSAVFVIAILLIILFNTNILPADIYTVSGIIPIGGILVGVLITAMGCQLDFAELKRQWKTVVISIVGVIVATCIVILIGWLLFEKDLILAGAPVFAGGSGACVIMTTAMNDIGRPDLATFAVLMLACQNFVGIPVASFLLKKSARNFVKDESLYDYYRGRLLDGVDTVDRKRLIRLPAFMDIPSVAFAKICLVTVLSFYLSQLTDGKVNYIIIALVLGTVFSELGFLDKNIFEKTEASGMVMFLTLMIVFANLATTSIQQIISMLVPLMVTLCLGALSCIVGGIVLGKLLKTDIYLASCMIMTCMFGFPTTLLMSNEVSEAIGDEKEKTEVIGSYLRPKMITAGFITGIFSIVIAGFISGMI